MLSHGLVTLTRDREPYLSIRVSPDTLLRATHETFDPFPGAQPLWGDVSVFPTSSTLSPLHGSWGFLPILQNSRLQLSPITFENSSRDSEATSFQPNQRTDLTWCRADYSAKQ